MTKAVFQIGSRIFRSEFMTMRSTVSAWTAPAEASSAAAATNQRTTRRLQRQTKASGRFMAFLPSHWDNATQREQGNASKRTRAVGRLWQARRTGTTPGSRQDKVIAFGSSPSSRPEREARSVATVL